MRRFLEQAGMVNCQHAGETDHLPDGVAILGRTAPVAAILARTLRRGMNLSYGLQSLGNINPPLKQALGDHYLYIHY